MELKCSKCSTTVQPIVAVDVDGTLAEYHRPLAMFCAKYFDIQVPIEDWDGRGEMEDYLGITKDQWRDLKFAYRSGGFKRFAPVYPGGVSFVNYAHGRGCEVWLTTTRPWMRLDSIDPDTRWWLERNFVYYDHLIYDEHKYELLGRLVDPGRVIMVVDDLDVMLSEAALTFGMGVDCKIARPHNKSGSYPGFTFGELVEQLDRKVTEWYRNHQ